MLRVAQYWDSRASDECTILARNIAMDVDACARDNDDIQYIMDSSFELVCCAHDAEKRKMHACDILLATYARVSTSILKRALPLLECIPCRKTITKSMLSANGRTSHIIAQQTYEMAYDEVFAHPIDEVARDYISGAFIGACASLDITRALALYLLYVAKTSTDNADHKNDYLDEPSATPARVMRDGITAAATMPSAQVNDIAELIACLCAKPVIACVLAKGEQIDARNLLKWIMRDDVVDYMVKEGIRAIDN